MECLYCGKPIEENAFRINCSDCGDFDDEVCYNKYHDENHGCPQKSS